MRTSIDRSLCFLLLCVPTSAQTTWYVDVNGSPPGSGTEEDPYTSIQYAIDQPTTLSGDALIVAPGTYVELIDFSGKTLGVHSTVGSAATVIEALGMGTAVTFSGGEAAGTLLEGFTLQGGAGTVAVQGLIGGGVACSNATVVIRACRFTADNAELGGAVHAEYSDLELEGCVIEDVDRGGGVYADSMLRLELDGCTVQRVEPNSCSLADCYLGGLTARLSTVTLTGCTFEENKAYSAVDPDSASAVTLLDSTSTIVNCTFHRNGNHDFWIDQGGALVAIGGQLDVQTSTFTDNRNEYRGGAIALRDIGAQIEDCVFTDNRSADDYWGGGIYVSTAGSTDLTVRRTTFVHNRGGDGGGIFLGAGQALIEACSFEDNLAVAQYYEEGAGGGIYVGASVIADVVRCDFAGNLALGNDFLNPIGGRGGAVFGPAFLDRCTMVANVATHGFLSSEGGAAHGAQLSSCIAWNNEPDELAGSSTANWSDVRGGFPGTDNIDADPLFWDEAGRDFYLKAGSPCIDTGDPSAPLDADGTRADMGAFPHDPIHCATPRNYCTSKTNSQGCLPAIGSVGTPTIGGGDDFHVVASQVINKQNGILIWSRGEKAVPFYGGTLCLDSPIQRTGLQNSGGNIVGTDCSGTFDFHFSEAYMAAKGVETYDSIYAQFWYRDPMGSFGVGLTDALHFVVCPLAAQ